MKSLNRVFIMGHLGATPILKKSKTDKPYTRLSVATNYNRQIEDRWEQITEWHSVFVWGTLAEKLAQSMQKGALVFIEGALTYWQVAQEGDDKKAYRNAIHATEVRFQNPASRGLDNLDGPRNHDAVAHPA